MIKRPITAIMAACLLPAACLALPKGYFAPSSRLASGRWVKVGVTASGIYEISHEQLRQMGFDDPMKVGVYGRGGRQMDPDFTDASGNPLNPDDLSPISVTHIDGKLYFYGQGTESFRFELNSAIPGGGCFRRASKNIYSDLGYYFLSDREGSVIEMETATLPKGGRNGGELIEGLGMVSHERDLYQNSTTTGQLFWGEKFNDKGLSRQTFDISLPDAIEEGNATMECIFYAERRTTGTLSWGIIGADGNVGHSIMDSNTSNFKAQEPNLAHLTVPSRKGEVFVDYQSDDNPLGTANLDYWTLTYLKKVPTLRDPDGNPLSQDMLTVALSPSEMRDFTCDVTGTLAVFDVTDPLHPKIIDTATSGKQSAGTVAGSSKGYTSLIFADTSRPQLQISGYGRGYDDVANQDVHSLAAEGVDFLIITLDEYLPQAERLARLHRDHDGTVTAVVTAGQLYNEFSAGVPDPMAYRACAKMLYESPGRRLRNVLLLGPLRSDFRGVDVPQRPDDALIAYQNPQTNATKGAGNVNDFIGMTSDFIGTTQLESAPVDIGVGILPVSDAAEAENIVDKVERYLSRSDGMAYTINEIMTIGGLGDTHSHDIQARDLPVYLNSHLDGHLIPTVLAIDAYGNKQARKKMISTIENGKNIVVYFGHGGPAMLGKDLEFFSTAEIRQLHNTHLPLMIFAGCMLSNTDRGERGLGEVMVMNSKDALIGAVLATRDTWSGENLDFVKILLNRMWHTTQSVGSPLLDSPVTLGEVFAHAKTQSTSTNELAYQLVADPAITVPVATRKIEIDKTDIIPSRGKYRVTGRVLTPKGETDRSFNGEAVVKLIEPARRLLSQDLETGDRLDADPSKGENDKHLLYVTYADNVATMASANVRGGEFEVTLRIPESFENFKGEKAMVACAAFDPDAFIGAASQTAITVMLPASGTIDRKDTTPPVIVSFDFDPMTESLSIKATDNQALNLSRKAGMPGIELVIDGKPRTQGIGGETRIDPATQALTRRIPVGWLDDGDHTARVTVYDDAGNSASAETLFTLGLVNYLQLSLKEEAARDRATFTVGESRGNRMRLDIADALGKTVFSASVSGESYEWDLKGSDGKRVAPGLYKATLTETGPGELRHSAPVDVPVF